MLSFDEDDAHRWFRIRESGGTAVAGREDRILPWMRRVAAAEGIGICPETAVCFDCLEMLVERGQVRGDESVVVFNTAAAQKYAEVMAADLPRLDKDQPVDWNWLGAMASV